FLDDYQELVNMYRLVRAAYEPGVSVDKSFMRKTAYLVQRETWTSAIREVGPDYVLNEQALEQIAVSQDSDTVKVFNLIKALEQIVQRQSGQAPYLISIGERAEQIVQAFQERQLTTQQALEQLQQLLAEYQTAERERQETDLSKEGFTVYWLLERGGVTQAKAVAREVMAAFERYPHWRMSSEQERQVRIVITKALVRERVEQVSEHTERILQMLRRAE
ncbi:MAG: type I restriction endonuclease subunit R, partial [Anaerolineae bacterium]